MRVSMKIEERSEKVSMFKSMQIHCVVANIELSEEEQAAIHQLKLGDYTLITAQNFLPIDLKTLGTERNTPVAALIHVQRENRPFVLKYPDPIQAQHGMAELKQKLTDLKGMLNRADAPKEDSFEL